jgi:hypothetical protein
METITEKINLNNSSTIKLFNKKDNSTIHIITKKNKEYLNKLHIYYCFINHILPIIKDNINKNNKSSEEITNNYLIRLGINNNLINEDYEIINENVDICIFNHDKIDDIFNEIENIYHKITNLKLQSYIDVSIIEKNNNESLKEYNESFEEDEQFNNNTTEVKRNKCKYCNKEFKRLACLPKHETTCKKNIDK